MKNTHYMRIAALIVCSLLAISSAVVLIYSKSESYAIGRMDGYFKNHFNDTLAAAINGGVRERSVFIRIYSEYPLDGEYSELYWHGLEKIGEKIGNDILCKEIVESLPAKESSYVIRLLKGDLVDGAVSAQQVDAPEPATPAR